jgi:ParB family chromosome partitioning protein
MWDILNFLKNPSSENPKEKNTFDSEARKRQINAQLEDAIQNPASAAERAAKKEAEKARSAEQPDGKKDLGAFRSRGEAERELSGRAADDEGAHDEKPAEDSPAAPKQADETAGRLFEIAVSSIKPNPFQPRKELGEQEILELSESIKEFGVLQPILVRREGGGYELIAGERRLRAAERAGLVNIPAIVVEIEPLNQQIIALVENIQRKNLSPIEEAISLQDILTKTGWKQTELSRRMGRSQASIANKLRLLRLDSTIQDMILQGKLGERQARSLLSLPAEEQKILAQKAIDEDLSTKEIESIAENWNSKPRTQRSKTGKTSNEAPGGELLGDVAALVNRHRARGTMAQWKVKQMNQSSLVVEITVDLLRTGSDEEEIAD